jgi:putative membrane protein
MLELARYLPSVNAALNGTSAILLAIGYRHIRRGRVAAHRGCMLAAFSTSTLFLASYLMLRYLAGMTRYTGEGWLRAVYFVVLGTHTVLAACIVPLAVFTLMFALRGRFFQHRWIARWTLPLWLYVSVTGVVVYMMLYHV